MVPTGDKRNIKNNLKKKMMKGRAKTEMSVPGIIFFLNACVCDLFCFVLFCFVFLCYDSLKMNKKYIVKYEKIWKQLF